MNLSDQTTYQKTCRIEGCQKTIYAKNLCHYHYLYILNFKKEPLPVASRYKKCIVEGCDRSIARSFEAHRLELCNKHMVRYRSRREKNILTDIKLLSVDLRTYNKKNRQTKFMYKDHYDMKKIRKKIINENSICIECGRDGYLVLHHIDNTKHNHSIENFKILCQRCHLGKYHPRKKTKIKKDNHETQG